MIVVECLSSTGLTQANFLPCKSLLRSKITLKEFKRNIFMFVPTFLLMLTAEVTSEVFAFSHFSMGLKNSTSTALPPWAQNGHSPLAALLTTGESITRY